MKKDCKVVVLSVVVFFIVVSSWFTSWAYMNQKDLSYESAGQFGDKFGFINSLFSGLALGGIIISLFLQKDELALQRIELRETREEFKQQNFESTFFNLLKNQQEISKRIKAQFYGLTSPLKIGQREANGLDFFYYSKRQLTLIFSALEKTNYEKYDADEIEYTLRYEEEHGYADDSFESVILEDARHCYAIDIYNITKEKHTEYKGLIELDKLKLVYYFFFNKYQQFIGNYFRHFYHILKFIKESESKELKGLDQIKDKEEIQEITDKYFRYAQFLQAQMTTDELMLMFYNCSKYPKALELVTKYKILDNLSIEDLVDKKHNCVTAITLKNRG